jgi:IS6 family transposase
MPITVTNPFKGRQYPGEVILQAVRWYLRYPFAYEHVAELLAERGLAVDASCVWRWVQVYSPELNMRCQPHLKRTHKSYRVDETYIKVKGQEKYLYRAVDSTGQTIDFLLTAKRDTAAAKRFFERVFSSSGCESDGDCVTQHRVELEVTGRGRLRQSAARAGMQTALLGH